MSRTESGFFDLIENKLSSHPELLARARENCDRWLAQRHTAPDRLRHWDALLAAAQDGPDGWSRLRDALLSPDPEMARLRDFHPFAGLLTREERRHARELCGYRH